MGFPVQWGRTAPRRHCLHFVKCPPDRLVYMLDSPEDFVTIRLHWLAGENESAPCLGEECPLMGLTRHFTAAYSGVMQYAERERRWMQAILCIGDPGHTLANVDFQGQKIIIGKLVGTNEKRLLYKGTPKHETPEVPHICQPFDIRANLLERWGFFEEAQKIHSGENHIGHKAHENQQEKAG